MVLEGACHCGAITIELETAREPAELPVRTCGCTFCTKHRPRYTADPTGHVTIRLASTESASQYRFGLRLADFIICRTCGVFVAAYEPGVPGRAVVNLDVLARGSDFTGEPIRFTGYDSEDVHARSTRRAKNWTPASIVVST